MKTIALTTTAALLAALVAPVFAEWHGPAFGLATPTLGTRQFSSDTVAMSMGTDEGTAFQFREMIGYGITEDFQLNLNFPLSPTINELDRPPRSRLGLMMGPLADVELSAMWRFQRNAFGVGKRLESTVLFGGGAPTDTSRGLINDSPYLNAAVVTGYASRTHYAWVGAGFQRNFERGGDRLGDLPYVSAVYGYRPPFFQKAGAPDWRIFVESVAEFPQRNRVNGRADPNSGGEKVMLGPSLLGLYGAWGVSGGVLFPAYERGNGNLPRENFRAKVVFTYWF